MSNLIKSRAAKFIGTFVAVVMIVGVVAPSAVNAATLTESQIDSILNLLTSFGADQATIDNVDSALRGEPTSGTGTTGGSTSGVCPYVWSRNLQVGNEGTDVMKLQQFLNDELSSPLASSGPGSPGNETSYYGSITANGVKRFQEKYSSEILQPLGLSQGTNFFWTSTRAKANELCETASTGDGGTTTTPTGSASVVSVTQPSNSLAPLGASRIPFTKFAIRAGANDVTLKDVTVERVGLGSNDAFSGIQLQDENGILLGNSKTLNSNNRARLGESHVIEAGTTETFTVVGNMPSTSGTNAGEVLTLNVVNINTDANLSAAYPIKGASHTVNETLSIGSATITRGALDPNTNTTKEVGTTSYTFQSIKVTAGSSEDVRLKSVRWDQTGSVSEDDLENVIVTLDGTEYETTVNGGGDKYTAVFGGDGVLIKKGFSKEVSIKGDITGGSDRTVNFDIEKATDIHIVGETFGYGITPTHDGSQNSEATTNSGFPSDGSPFFDASEVTVSTGSLTISASNDVPAGNVANGASDVNLGSFKFDVRGEPVNWSSIKFTVSTTANASANGALTNITLVDSNGTVLAGPEDLSESASTVTLSDSVSLDTGVHVLYVRGNLDTNWEDSDTLQVKLTPTNITSLEGDTTGRSITPTPSSQLLAKTQTVSAGALTISPSTALASQNIIADSSDVLLGKFVLDATASGEDMSVTVAKFRARVGSNMDVDDLNTLQLFDEDGNALNTGSNNVNPSGTDAATAKTLTFTLDEAVVIPKGSSVVWNLRGNVATGTNATTNSTVRFDFNSLTDGDWTVTGEDTGKEVVEDLIVGSNGAQMTISSGGTLTASLSPSDPVEKWYVSGQTGTIGVFELDSATEDFDLTDLGLLIDTASSSSADFSEISLWDGSKKVLSKTSPAFTNNKELFTFTSGDFRIPADDEKDLTVKAKFANIGTSQVGTSGNLLKVSTTTTASQNRARGLESGTKSDILGSASTSTGARYFKSLPTVALVDDSDCSPDATISGGTDTLYCFSVTANSNGRVLIEQMTFQVSTSSPNATATDFKLTRVSDGAIVDQSIQADKNNRVKMQVDSTEGFSSGYITISAGTTQKFRLEATTEDGSNDQGRIETKLLRDTSYPSLAAPKVMAEAANIDSAFFVWSPRSTTSSLTARDWTNSYKVPGLETSNLGSQTLTD